MTPLPPGLVISTEDCLSTPDEADKIKNIPFMKL